MTDKTTDCGSVVRAIQAWIPDLEAKVQEARWHAADAEREGESDLRDRLMRVARLNEGRIRTLRGALEALECSSVAERLRSIEHQSVSRQNAYVVADNNFVSGTALADPFTTFGAAARERDALEQAAPERDYRVVCLQGAKTTGCKSVAPVDLWLKFAEQWAHDADQEGELGEAKGHRTWGEVFDEHLARRTAHERHEAAVASVMFQDDSWMPGEQDTESGSVAVPFVHARRLLDWLRWSGTDEWDSTEPGPPEWRDAFLAFERVVVAAEKRLGPPPPYCGHTECASATEQESKDED